MGRPCAMKPIAEPFAELRARRLQLGITQDELAHRAGVSKGWWGKVETGVIKGPDAFMVDCIRQVLTTTLPDAVR